MTYSDLHKVDTGVALCQVTELSAGPDWLTLTLPIDAPHAALWHVGNIGIIKTIASGGYPEEPRSIYGYDGIGAGGSFAGETRGRYMVILSGERASTHFDAVYRSDANVPRIDIQATAKYDLMPHDIAQRSYDYADAHNRRLPEHRRRKLYILMGSDGGDTLYLGSPSSEARGRIYNKEKQSKDTNFANSWRYEISFKNDAAKRLAAVIATQDDARSEYCAAYVRNWYGERGIPCAYDIDRSEVVLPPTKRAKPTLRRRLEWLYSQVAPTVRWLREEGYTEEAIAALGLSDLLPPA